jgi:hypothetical protein
MILKLTGPFPTKKNERGAAMRREDPKQAALLDWMERSGRKVKRPRKVTVFVKDETRIALAAITAQLRVAWGNRPPIEHPDVVWRWTLKERRKDRDNLKTTVLDCMKKAGVIVDDNIARYNGHETVTPVEIDPAGPERLVLEITNAEERLKVANSAQDRRLGNKQSGSAPKSPNMQRASAPQKGLSRL